MASTTSHPIIRFLRIFTFATTALLSICLPLWLMYWLAFAIWGDGSELWTIQFGEKSTEFNLYGGGVIKDGELWFTSYKTWFNSRSRQYCDIKRLDLKTGVERKTRIRGENTFDTPFLIGNQVYLASGFDINKIEDSPDGATTVKVATFEPKTSNGNVLFRGPSFRQPPHIDYSGMFLYEGKLTAIQADGQNRTRLSHLVDGNWIAGQEILLPVQGDYWIGEADKEKPHSVPDESEEHEDFERFMRQQELRVLQEGDRYRLILKTINDHGLQRYVYRDGFEFIDEDPAIVSALFPANLLPEVSGWKPWTKKTKINYFQIGSDSNGPLLCQYGGDGIERKICVQICRLDSEGNYQEVGGLDLTTFNSVLIDPSTNIAYVVEELDDGWNSVAFRRINGDTIEPAFLVLNGNAAGYVARWRYYYFGMIVAWIAHYVLVTGAIGCLTAYAPVKIYEVDLQQSTIAPVWRRLSASTIDLSLSLILLFLLWHLFNAIFFNAIFAVSWSSTDDKQLGDFFYAFHSNGWQGMAWPQQFGLNSPDPASVILSKWATRLIGQSVFYGCWLGTFIVLLGAKLVFEGWYGITPGKWFLRIRTVNSFFGRTNLFTSVLRSLFCLPDFCLFFTPIPAATFMLLSKNHRRLGDFFANSTVIKAGSIGDIEWRQTP